DLFDDAGVARDLDRVADAERPLDEHPDAGEKVLEDVLEREADDDPHHAERGEDPAERALRVDRQDDEDADREDQQLGDVPEQDRDVRLGPIAGERAEAVGLASTSAVHHHLTKLEKEGRLQKEATRSRALTLPGQFGGRVVHAPVIGEIAAGQPIHAYEDRSESLALPSDLAARG